MRQPSTTGLASIVAHTVRSVLADSPALVYNWNEKLHGLVVGICLSRSLLLQSIAQTRPQKVKATEKQLSMFLGRGRLRLNPVTALCAIHVLKRFGRRRVWRHDGKAVLVIDTTSHAKPRSRRKKRPMPGKGRVRLHNVRSEETLLVPGYQEIWIGILLEDRTVLPLTRRLWSENGPDSASMNLAELAEIRRARDIVKAALGLDVILVADSGFRRKELLHWLKKSERMDFVIRLEGKLTVFLDQMRVLLTDTAQGWRMRATMLWREKSKRVLLSEVAARRLSVVTEQGEKVSFNVLCLTPARENVPPMFLATTLKTTGADDLVRIGRLYSWRWGIETLFWKFKEGMRGSSWRVFSSWGAIDNLLAAALMAYLVMMLLAELVKRGATDRARKLKRLLVRIIRDRFARPPIMTQGRFMRLIAMDFPSPRWAGGEH